MSVEALAQVLHHSRLSGTAKLVLLGIANHEGDGGAFPAIATLARYANTTERTVQRAIAEAVAAGELQVDEQAGGTAKTRADRRPNLYRTLVTCPLVCDRSANHRMSGNGVTPMTPRGSDGVTLVTPRGDTGDANGVTLASPEPSDEPSVEPFMSDVPSDAAQVAVVEGVDKREARRLAEYLSERLAELGIPANKRVVTEAWVTEIRRMIQRDGRDPASIRKAIDWAMADSFWSGNIHSPAALRRGYDKMRLQAGRRTGGRDSQQAAVADEAALTGRPVADVRAEHLATIAATAALASRRTR